jgi:hypothetical protein
MGKASKSRGERVVQATIDGLDELRGALVQRLEDIDLEDVRTRGGRLADSIRSAVEARVRPRRRRWITPWSAAGIAGAAVVGAALAGAGYVAYDRERREAARRRLEDVQNRARERYAELTGGRSQAETDLADRVRKAVAEGGAAPDGLEVVVEGRTVYLRGAVPDPAFVDAAAERAHAVADVVAVVNLTTSATRDEAGRPA